MLAFLKHHGKKPHKGRSGLPKFGKEKGSPYFHEFAFTPQIKIFYKITSPESLTLLPTVQVSLLLHHWTVLSLCMLNKYLDIKFGSLLTFVLFSAPDRGLFPQQSEKHHSFLLLIRSRPFPSRSLLLKNPCPIRAHKELKDPERNHLEANWKQTQHFVYSGMD